MPSDTTFKQYANEVLVFFSLYFTTFCQLQAEENDFDRLRWFDKALTQNNLTSHTENSFGAIAFFVINSENLKSGNMYLETPF